MKVKQIKKHVALPLVAILSAVLMSSYAMSATSSPTKKPQNSNAQVTDPIGKSGFPVELKGALLPGMKVLKGFDIPDSKSLNGWVLEREGTAQKIVVYTTKDNQFLIAGQLIDNNSKNVSAEHNEMQNPKPLFKELEKTKYFEEGHKGKIVYIFFDPKCGYCMLTDLEFKPYLATNNVRVRWVPVGVLGPDSIKISAHLLNSKNPDKLLHEQYEKMQQGGILSQIKNEPSEKDKKILADNLKMMGSFGGTGTPLIVYADEKGVAKTSPGAPKLSSLPLITGLPAIENFDERLAKFK